MSTGWGSLTDRILLLLGELGPMTLAQLQCEVGSSTKSLSKTLRALSRQSKRFSKRVYVSSWVYEADGQRRYPRAVYAIGSKPCKPRPVADKNAVKRRYWENRKARLTSASIFRLGGPTSAVMRAGWGQQGTSHED